ncbi:recombinase family protein [Streptomyces mirabilis]|uniref:recombinase family protein n=1 Tax=Streptomyces mirabilis TaxID=68239 RepID=UPI00338E8128
MSYREIAAALDTEVLRPKRGERWHPETVRRMLANTARFSYSYGRRTGGGE